MKKLNKKGMSIIELLVCFVIVTIVAITLLNTLMEYKSEEQIENTKSYVETYKNTVSRVIQSDITDYGLKGVSNITMTDTTDTNDKGETVSGRKLEATLEFSRNFYDGTNQKKLVIFRSDKLNYIMYQDHVQDGATNKLQDVKYELKPTSMIYDIDPSDNSNTNKKEYNDLRFEFLNERMIGIKNNNTFYLDIPISHSELGGEYHIKVVAPLNLLDKAIDTEDSECKIYYCLTDDDTFTCDYQNPKIVSKDSKFGTLRTPEQITGASFDGWNARGDCKGTSIDENSICKGGTINAYSCWSNYKVNVQFNMNGGSWAGSTREELSYDSSNYVLYNQSRIVKTYKYNTENINLPDYDNPDYINITRVGYNVPKNAEWKLSGSNKTFSHSASTIKANEFCDASNGDCTATLNVNWTPKTLDVVFYKNDGTTTSQTKTYTYDVSGQKFSKLYTRTGYELVGWAFNENATTTNFAPEATVTNNWINSNQRPVKLYAVWKPISINVTFHKNDGTETSYIKTYTYDVSGQKLYSSYTREGYTLEGWAFDKNATTPNYEPAAPVANSWISSHANGANLYAVWSSCTYTVRFNKNASDATGTMSNQTFTQGTAKALSNNGFARTGYTFKGWATSSNGNVVYTNRQSVNNLSTCGGTVDLYAKWEVNNYKLTVDANGGTMYNDSELSTWETTFTYGNVRGISTNSGSWYPGDTPNKPVREGYTFIGWKVSAGAPVYLAMNGTVPVYYIDGKYAGDLTVTAQWIPNSYSIDYELNKGTSGVNHPSGVVYNAEFYVSNPTKQIKLTFINKEGATVDYKESSVSESGGSVNYKFTGWHITGMDSVTHTYGALTTTNTSISSTQAIKFKNLRSTSGTVLFTANWEGPTIILPTVEKEKNTCVWTSDGLSDKASGGTYAPTDATERTFTAKCTENKPKIKKLPDWNTTKYCTLHNGYASAAHGSSVKECNEEINGTNCYTAGYNHWSWDLSTGRTIWADQTGTDTYSNIKISDISFSESDDGKDLNVSVTISLWTGVTHEPSAKRYVCLKKNNKTFTNTTCASNTVNKTNNWTPEMTRFTETYNLKITDYANKKGNYSFKLWKDGYSNRCVDNIELQRFSFQTDYLFTIE